MIASRVAWLPEGTNGIRGIETSCVCVGLKRVIVVFDRIKRWPFLIPFLLSACLSLLSGQKSNSGGIWSFNKKISYTWNTFYFFVESRCGGGGGNYTQTMISFFRFCVRWGKTCTQKRQIAAPSNNTRNRALCSLLCSPTDSGGGSVAALWSDGNLVNGRLTLSAFLSSIGFIFSCCYSLR